MNLSLPNLWIETFGMTLIEGFYFGSPCIAFNYGGPKEIVHNNKNGILIESDSINEIISSIRIITKDLNQYQSFSKNATLACLKYEAEFISDQIFKIVNNHSK